MNTSFVQDGVRYDLVVSNLSLKEVEARNARLIGELPEERTVRSKKVRRRKCRFEPCGKMFLTINYKKFFCSQECFNRGRDIRARARYDRIRRTAVRVSRPAGSKEQHNGVSSTR